MHFVSKTLNFALHVYYSIQWEKSVGMQTFELNSKCDQIDTHNDGYADIHIKELN